MQNRQTEDKFVVRMPEGLRHLVKSIASQNRRSMNAEILIAIERSMQQQTPETQNGSVTA